MAEATAEKEPFWPGWVPLLRFLLGVAFVGLTTWYLWPVWGELIERQDTKAGIVAIFAFVGIAAVAREIGFKWGGPPDRPTRSEARAASSN